MKILIATGIFPPDIGGPATYSKLLAEELAKRGHGVVIVTYGPSLPPDGNRAYVVKRVSRALPKGIRHIAYWYQVLRAARFVDCVYAQDPVSAGLPALCAARIMGKKFLVRVAGDYAWEQGMQRFGVKDLLDEFLEQKYGFFVETLRQIERRVALRAAKVIVPSEYLKKVVARWDVPEKRIAVVHNSVRPPREISRDEARKRLELDGIVLVAVGRFVPWKGFPMLVWLAAALRERFPVTLVAIGDGPGKSELEDIVRGLRVGEYVRMPGTVSREVLDEYLAAADIFLQNTAYEGFSHQILEAMVSGVAVVTTPAGGNREIAVNGENCLLVPFNERDEWQKAVTFLLENPQARELIASAGKAYRGTYSVDRMMEKVIAVLSAV